MAGFVTCDPPTIHHETLNCKLSRAVKFKSFNFKIRFLQKVAFTFVKTGLEIILIKFYLPLAGKIVDLSALFASESKIILIAVL